MFTSALCIIFLQKITPRILLYYLHTLFHTHTHTHTHSYTHFLSRNPSSIQKCLPMGIECVYFCKSYPACLPIFFASDIIPIIFMRLLFLFLSYIIFDRVVFLFSFFTTLSDICCGH